MKIEVITNNNEFAVLREQWNDLLLKSALDNVFLTHEWLFSWWEVFGGGCELFILLCKDGPNDELVGVFPGYIKISGMPIKLRIIKFLGSEFVTSDFLECFAQKGMEREVYDLFFEFIKYKKKIWDVVELTDVDEDSLFSIYLDKQTYLPQFAVSDNNKKCPYIILPDGWDKLLEGLSQKRRQSIKYYRKSLNKQFEIIKELVTEDTNLNNVLDEMIQIHKIRRNSVETFSKYEDKNYVEFHKKIIGRFIKNDWLELSFLIINNTRVAYWYNFKFKSKIFAYQTAFDHQWSKYSVGSVLLGYVVEKAIADGLSHLEFLRGHEQYKYHWTEQERKLLDFAAYNDSIRGNIAEVARQTYSGAKSGLKKILPDSLFDKAKKIKNSFSSDR